MHRLADEVREVFEDRGYLVGTATALDVAFRRSRRPQSTLSRSLVLDALEEAAGRLGLGSKSVGGGGYDIGYIDGGIDHRFRVRKADVDADSGEYDIICKDDSILVIEDAEPDSIFRTERWIFGYTVDDLGMVADIFAARVLGVTEGSVPRIRMSAAQPLGSTRPVGPPTGTYIPADEDDLEGFEEGLDDEAGDSDLG